MTIIDCLNNQFLLNSYLKQIPQLEGVSQYIKNNNLNINYYCNYRNICIRWCNTSKIRYSATVDLLVCLVSNNLSLRYV